MRLTSAYAETMLWRDGTGGPPEPELPGELFQRPSPFLNSILFRVLMMGDVQSMTRRLLALRVLKAITAR